MVRVTRGSAASSGLRNYKKEMSERFGMICFCKHWHNPLLWSHYAEKHRGMCLGFDVDDRGLRPVKYVKERSALKMPPTKESMDILLFTKYRDWKYEEELRNGSNSTNAKMVITSIRSTN